LNVVPGFLVKRIYCKGSLRKTAQGIAFDLKNLLGPGIITGINFIKINDVIYHSNLIKIISSEFSTFGGHINSENPLLLKLNQEITCFLEGAEGLKQGINKIIVEIVTRDIGQIQATLTDTV